MDFSIEESSNELSSIGNVWLYKFALYDVA